MFYVRPGLVRAGGVALALSAAAGGCSDNGSYEVAWGFGVAAVTEPAASGCGAHGVDAIGIVAGDDHGDHDTTEVTCASGQITRSVPSGSWQITAVALDIEGNPIASIPGASATAVVEDGKNAIASPTLVFTPPSECSDGIDNDGDGRVDADDPDCAGGSVTE